MTLPFVLLHVTVEVKPQCYRDDDCQYDELCNQGSCINACRVTSCGVNARCETGYHSASCVCPQGYTGNPEVACTLCKYLGCMSFFFLFTLYNTLCMTLCFLVGLPTEPVISVGCSSNDDCPDYTACENQKCINPCAESSPCARTAICKVVNHQAVCTCPNGFIGSPHTGCTPRK